LRPILFRIPLLHAFKNCYSTRPCFLSPSVPGREATLSIQLDVRGGREEVCTLYLPEPPVPFRPAQPTVPRSGTLVVAQRLARLVRIALDIGEGGKGMSRERGNIGIWKRAPPHHSLLPCWFRSGFNSLPIGGSLQSVHLYHVKCTQSSMC
jgi:hypothetical protein